MRLFLAAELPEPVKGALARVQERLEASRADVRWTRPEQWHLTLKFLGSTDEALLDDVKAAAALAAAGVGEARLEVRGIGTFPGGKRPRVIWAGVEEPAGKLARVAERLEDTMAELGFAKENRKFKAHVTLGRARSPRGAEELVKRVKKDEAFEGGGTVVKEIVLFESHLHPQGARYEAVARFPLGG